MDQLKEANEYRRHFFGVLSEFFDRATGKKASQFASIEEFSGVIRKNAAGLARRAADAFPWLERQIRPFYAREAAKAFRLAQSLGGLKLVQGGGSRFLGSQLAATRGSLLYADTVLIPDPISPWLEVQRDEERFQHVLLLQAAHVLLHLKAFVDADLPIPPIFVFPSVEKLLEAHDRQTREGILQLTTDVVARFVDPGVLAYSDVTELARQHPDRFMPAIDAHNLLVAPGGTVGTSLWEVLQRYENEMATWRSAEWLKDYHAMPMHAKALNVLVERISPQYHMLENSSELNAHPLVCVEQQAHYFGLIANLNRDRLEKIGLLDAKTRSIIDALSSRQLAWLADAPTEGLLEMRQRNDNVEFRHTLEAAVGELHASRLEDVNAVAAEICLAISRMVAEHDRKNRESLQHYRQKHLATTMGVAAATVGAIVPSLAPYVGTAIPFAVALKYGFDGWDQYVDKRSRAGSLAGVLAVAKAKSG